MNATFYYFHPMNSYYQIVCFFTFAIIMVLLMGLMVVPSNSYIFGAVAIVPFLIALNVLLVLVGKPPAQPEEGGEEMYENR